MDLSTEMFQGFQSLLEPVGFLQAFNCLEGQCDMADILVSYGGWLAAVSQESYM